jgi:phosphoenolpyruvate synthase/pyruvate phosphate dikinase
MNTLSLAHEQRPVSSIGGKGFNLFRLKEAGVRVPEFVVIPQEIMWATLGMEAGDDERVAQAIRECEVPDSLLMEIVSTFSGNGFLAVRSSSVDEDGAQFSFAGQFDSYLFVKKKDLATYIRKVWLSAFSERVVSYRKSNGLPSGKGIAVVIQRMVNAEKAGVVFSVNPTNGRKTECLIGAVFGLGEGLVSGELDADNFVVSGTEVHQTLADKTHSFVIKDEIQGGTALVDLPSELKHMAVLNSEEALRIAAVAKQLENAFGCPQDIEWCIENNELYIVQARPITAIKEEVPNDGEEIVWDNSNIIESYPGLSSPLTFSFIIKMYAAVYRQMCGIMGVSVQDIEENKEVFDNMLGLLHGRVYYNLLSWYKVLALLPGYDLNAEFMERMMGVKERFELKNRKSRSTWNERMRVMRMVRIMIRNFRGLPSERETFQREFNEVMRRYDSIDLNTRSAEELMVLYLEFEQTLLKKWRAPLVNDFFAMIFFGITQKLTEKYALPSGIHNDLLCGARDIISTEPIKRCLRISTMIQENSGCKKLFIENTPEQILGSLSSYPEIHREILAYIERFGERCVGELKLETITYKQQPADFIRVIKSYVEQGIMDHEAGNQDVAMREAAELVVREKLKGHFWRRRIFNYFLTRARVLVSARENLRFERTRGFGKVREIFCAIGERFHALGLIEAPRDIFYLTQKEIFGYIKGTSVEVELKKLVALRKETYAQYESKKLPERIRTRGVVYLSADVNASVASAEALSVLQGLGCCPGVVRARVCVVHHPSEVSNLNGDILVTSSTDPGWVTLFPTASAILVERGSLLSHSAIVSREMGKPCVVGVKGLLDQLQTGDEVELDGSTGKVVVLKRANGAEVDYA